MRIRFTLSILILASASVGAQTPIHVLSNDSPGTWSRVENAGDVDADGRPDVIASGALNTRVFSGLNGVPIHTFPSAPGILPPSGDGAGDVDLDGHADLVVGEPGHSENGEGVGATWVYSGKDGSVLFSTFGDVIPTPFGNTPLRMGRFVAGPGDTDGDGYPDWMTTREGADDVADAALLYSGKDGALRFRFEDTDADGGGAWPTIGQHVEVAGAGDPNQDGFVDLLISFVPSPNFENCNSTVHLRSGSDGALIRDLSDPSICAFGLGLSAAGDLDGDGVDDQLVGSPYAYWSNDQFGGGAMIAVSGATGERLFTREASSSQGSFGYATDVAGDVDLDGSLDLVGGDSAVYRTAYLSGAVELFLGGSGPRLDCSIDGSAKLARQGISVAGLGDVDLDGRDDVVTLASGIEQVPGSAYGQATVWSFDGCAAAPAWFRPGSTLRGQITASDDVDAAEFEALAGTKLKVKLDSVTGDLKPRIELRRANGKLIKSWKPKPGDKAKKILLKKTDGYTLSVTGVAGTSGEWQLATSAKIKEGNSTYLNVVKKAKSASKPPKVTFRALAGAFAWADVNPKKDLGLPLQIRLVGPLGEIDVDPFWSTFTDDLDEAIVFLNVPVSGDYTVEVVDAVKGEKYELEISVDHPFGGELIDVD